MVLFNRGNSHKKKVMTKIKELTQQEKDQLVRLLNEFENALLDDTAFRKYIKIMDDSDDKDYEVQTHNLLHFINDVRTDMTTSNKVEA